ncbi:hypothetical protein GN956_G4696 [Arapaima gigas]
MTLLPPSLEAVSCTCSLVVWSFLSEAPVFLLASQHSLRPAVPLHCDGDANPVTQYQPKAPYQVDQHEAFTWT